MSIGIVTMTGDNYGSALQAYSLQKTLKDQGASCHTITLRPRSYLLQFARQYVFPNRQSCFQRWNKLCSDIYFSRKRRQIKSFYNRALTIRHYSSRSRLVNGERTTKAFICGSDQIWNPQFLPNYLFYLDFVVNNQTPRFSYAVSFAVSELSSEAIQYYQEKLGVFKRLSVREETGRKLLQQVFPNREIRVDVDPVILQTQETWRKLDSGRFQGCDYIFLYVLIPDPEFVNFACKLGEYLNLPIIYIGDYAIKKTNVRIVNDAGVEDFISAICNASLVLTNSFHATVFSTIFHTRFYAHAAPVTGSRVMDFLKVCNLLERNISSLEVEIGADWLGDLEWMAADIALSKQRAEGIAYLVDIVDEAEYGGK